MLLYHSKVFLNKSHFHPADGPPRHHEPSFFRPECHSYRISPAHCTILCHGSLSGNTAEHPQTPQAVIKQGKPTLLKPIYFLLIGSKRMGGNTLSAPSSIQPHIFPITFKLQQILSSFNRQLQSW